MARHEDLSCHGLRIAYQHAQGPGKARIAELLRERGCDGAPAETGATICDSLRHALSRVDNAAARAAIQQELARHHCVP